MAHHGRDLGDDRVVLLPGHQQPGGDRTALPRVRADHEGREHGGRGEVGIVEQDHGRLAAELQEDPLDRAAGRLHDPAAGGGGTGEGDHVHARVGGQQFAGLDAGGGEDVDHAGRDVGAGGDQLAQGQGDQRRVRGTLEHDRAAGRERGGQLGQRELVRVVVRDDRGHDPGGFLLHPAAMPLAAHLDLAEFLGHRVALEQVGVVTDDLDGLVQLGAVGELPGRADLRDGQLAQLLAVLAEHLVKLLQAPDAQLRVRRPVGAVESAPGRRDGGLGVRGRRVRGLAQRLPGGRIDRGECAPGGHQLPVDEQVPGRARRRGSVLGSVLSWHPVSSSSVLDWKLHSL